MNRCITKFKGVVLVLLLVAVVAGCGSGGGGGGSDIGTLARAILVAQEAQPSDPSAPNSPAVTAPTVTAVTPLNNASGVAIDTEVTAIFSKAMDAATITTTTFTLIGTIAGVSVPVIGGVAYYGQSAIFTPPGGGLTASTDYTATITTGAKDDAGTALAVDFSWTFTTGQATDTILPTVIATVPADTVINVAPITKIFATFRENMDPATITGITFTVVKDFDGSAVAGNVTYAVGARTATFTPTATLSTGIKFKATITTGAKDLAGNALLGNYVWTFTTGVIPDTTLPTITLTNPADLDTGVCTTKTINATFDEDMDPLTIIKANFMVQAFGPPLGPILVGTIAYDPVNFIASFTLFNPLAANTKYTATLTTGVKDLAGNALAADKVWTFTTGALPCTPQVALGAAASFGSLGGAATVTNDGLDTVINGDLGVAAASSKITGLRDSGGNVYTVTPNNDGLVNGLIYTLTAPPGSVAGAAVAQAKIDAQAAFDSLSPANLPGGKDVSSLADCPSCGGAGEGADALAGRTIPPGVYLSTTGVYDIGKLTRVQSILTLDAGGDANAVWVFQTTALTGTLTVGLTGPLTPASPIQVKLINGAQSKNVFWYVPAGATLGTGSTMVGTLLAIKSITSSTTGGGPPPNAVVTTLNGRAICLVDGMTMTNTVINVPEQ